MQQLSLRRDFDCRKLSSLLLQPRTNFKKLSVIQIFLVGKKGETAGQAEEAFANFEL